MVFGVVLRSGKANGIQKWQMVHTPTQEVYNIHTIQKRSLKSAETVTALGAPNMLSDFSGQFQT